MSAALKLEVFQNGELLKEIPLSGDPSSPEVWMGRDEGCVIHLDDRAISRKHALLRATAEGVEFEKKSKFGWVKLNGAESSQAILRNGDCLEMGPYEIRVMSEKLAPVAQAQSVEVTRPILEEEPQKETVKLEPANEEMPAEGQPEGEVPMGGFEFGGEVSHEMPPGSEEMPPVAIHSQTTNPNHDFSSASDDGRTKVSNVPEQVKALLIFGDGAANVTEYEIGDNEIAIGRSQQCHVVLEDKRSSRRHALIMKNGMQYILKDLGSANGTLLNGTRVSEQELQTGDQIQIGETVFSFRLMQADYEQRKQQFIPVPQSEFDAAPAAPQEFQPSNFSQEPIQPQVQAAFAVPDEPKKSLLGKYLNYYRGLNTKQQIIYGAVILALVWFLMQDEPEVQKTKMINQGQKKAQKKDEKKIGGPTFESLSPEQQSYIETQYQLAFELYKNREYDKALLELTKIFAIVQDYKQAREIESFAREGKRKLEIQEEERKRKEAERQAQLKLQSLMEQTGLLMDQKKYKEAEVLFPEIELLQPENAAVNEWRKLIAEEGEKNEREKAARKAEEEFHRANWAEFQKAEALVTSHQYYESLDAFDEMLTRDLRDKKLTKQIEDEISKVEHMIDDERNPVIAQAKQLEQDGKLIEAYKVYQKATVIDPVDTEAPTAMERIRGTLTGRAKSIYAEGVFAESYGDMDVAEKKYREVLDIVPKEDAYADKAGSRLRKLTVLKREPAGETPQ